MRKKFSIWLFIIAVFAKGIAQIDNDLLVGEWIEVGTEMKDGSLNYTPYVSLKYIHKFSFTRTHLQVSIISVSPIVVYPKQLYSIQEHEVIINEMSYEVDEITPKTLILSENIEGVESHNLRRYFLVKKGFLEKKKKQDTQDELLIATPYLTPTYKNVHKNPTLFKKISNTPYRTKGLLVIDLVNKESNVYLEDFEMKRPKDLEKEMLLLQEILSVPYEKWNLKGFENYQKIEIPFLVNNRQVNKKYELDIVYYKDDLSIFDSENYYPPSEEDKNASLDLYQKGIEAFNNAKYKDAISLFTQAFALDARNIDALYNKAVVYYHTNDLQNACSVWSELEALGQVKGKNFRAKNCFN